MVEVFCLQGPVIGPSCPLLYRCWPAVGKGECGTARFGMELGVAAALPTAVLVECFGLGRVVGRPLHRVESPVHCVVDMSAGAAQ